jgi:hypothetical protein
MRCFSLRAYSFSGHIYAICSALHAFFYWRACKHVRHVWSIRDVIIVDRDVRNMGCFFFSEVLFVPMAFLMCAHITASEPL